MDLNVIDPSIKGTKLLLKVIKTIIIIKNKLVYCPIETVNGFKKYPKNVLI